VGTIEIDGRRIGPGEKCYIVGEVAQAHDGSLGMAHAFIDAIANAGADAVKFQTHIASAESTPGEKFRVNFSYEDKTRQDYWKRMEFSADQWLQLSQHARQRGIAFLSSPFSLQAVKVLIQAGVPAWKIASGEVTNYLMFDRIAETGLPVLLSTGMSPWEEIDASVAYLRAKDLPLAVFQCTTSYPSPSEKIGLNNLSELRARYDCPVGLSDHSGTIYPGLAAATLGADLIEVHVTLSREMFGPDVPASVTTQELRQLVDGVNFIETMIQHPVDKDEIVDEFTPLRRTFFKSVVARVDLPSGTLVAAEHLDTRKPGTGIPANKFKTLIGRKLKRDVGANQLLSEEDFE
jgi:N-acetylneuraminate synthase